MAAIRLFTCIECYLLSNIGFDTAESEPSKVWYKGLTFQLYLHRLPFFIAQVVDRACFEIAALILVRDGGLCQASLMISAHFL